MPYIKLSDLSYPHTESSIRAENPQTSYPAAFPVPEDYAFVFATPKPAYDTRIQYVREIDPELTVLDTYEQRWEVCSLFKEYIDDVNVTHTVAEQETNAIIADLLAKKAALILQIDMDVDLIISAVVGKREIEYLKAEEHANAYIAANYTGTVPEFVQDWATAKSQTATWAADNIAATATAWRSAQASLRANRLAKKEAARTAADLAALATVETAWNAFVTAIKQQLGIS